MGRRDKDRLVEVRDHEYVVRFPFDEEVNDMMREVRGYFDRDEGAWIVRHTPDAERMMGKLESDYGFEIA